jgi:hypothetical protein
MLRPRLDALLSDTALADSAAQDITERLEAVCADLKPDDFLPTLLRALESALEPVQARLDEVIPNWLGARDGMQALHRLVQRHTLTPSGQTRALAWLEATGRDPAALQEFRLETPFYGAYRYADNSQGLINILWYTDGRRRHIQGLGFLIDYNPPWEGAIKDILVGEPSSPERALRRYVHFWTDRGMPLQPISEAFRTPLTRRRLRPRILTPSVEAARPWNPSGVSSSRWDGACAWRMAKRSSLWVIPSMRMTGKVAGPQND